MIGCALVFASVDFAGGVDDGDDVGGGIGLIGGIAAGVSVTSFCGGVMGGVGFWAAFEGGATGAAADPPDGGFRVIGGMGGGGAWICSWVSSN